MSRGARNFIDCYEVTDAQWHTMTVSQRRHAQEIADREAREATQQAAAATSAGAGNARQLALGAGRLRSRAARLRFEGK